MFKTHPNINKELYSNEGILGLKDPNRPFPSGQGDGVALVRWRMQSTDESIVPLTSEFLRILYLCSLRLLGLFVSFHILSFLLFHSKLLAFCFWK